VSNKLLVYPYSMSGHSKWSQIKHKKGVTDKKRSALFSKLLKAISVAAQENPDPKFNVRLKSAIEKARENNVPNDTIERAIKRSSEEEELSEVMIEAYGPEGTSFLIIGITNNTNRTISEVKKIIIDNDGKFANPGSVLWAFSKTEEGWRANFPQSISQNAKQKFIKLIDALENHDDITMIYTSVL
jgi:YebC/PmpR family DNA-binding regulatory protein